MGQNDMPVADIYVEHRVRQRFYDSSLNLNHVIFSHLHTSFVFVCAGCKTCKGAPDFSVCNRLSSSDFLRRGAGRPSDTPDVPEVFLLGPFKRPVLSVHQPGVAAFKLEDEQERSGVVAVRRTDDIGNLKLLHLQSSPNVRISGSPAVIRMVFS